MKRLRCVAMMILSLVTSLFFGCQRSTAKASLEPVKLGASYKAGVGLDLPDETRKALNLEIVEVEEEKLVSTTAFRVRIYSESNEMLQTSFSTKPKCAYATGILSPDQAKQFKVGQAVPLKTTRPPIEEFPGRIVRINQFSQSPVRGSEIIVEISDPEQFCSLGTEMEASIHQEKAESVPVVPRSALLKTFKGTFVYVVNGKSFLRTEVKTGTENESHIEIRGGLYPGDQIVKKPVLSLWVTELQATHAGQSCCVVGH